MIEKEPLLSVVVEYFVNPGGDPTGYAVTETPELSSRPMTDTVPIIVEVTRLGDSVSISVFFDLPFSMVGANTCGMSAHPAKPIVAAKAMAFPNFDIFGSPKAGLGR
jgi:hypothetical protein